MPVAEVKRARIIVRVPSFPLFLPENLLWRRPAFVQGFCFGFHLQLLSSLQTVQPIWPKRAVKLAYFADIADRLIIGIVVRLNGF
jgi:hypothetical protein